MQLECPWISIGMSVRLHDVLDCHGLQDMVDTCSICSITGVRLFKRKWSE